MYSIGDLVDKLVIENMKIFSLRDKMMDMEAAEQKDSREYTEVYQKMMLIVENRATVCNALDEKIEKVSSGKERNHFLKKLRTYNG